MPEGRIGAALGAAAADIGAVLLFAVVGRASHAEALTPAGAAETAWPFLAGLAVAWLSLLAWRSPRRLPVPAVPLWVITVSAGMLLRVVGGQGTAAPFVIVAVVALGVLLLGWRLVARWLSVAARSRANRAPGE